MLFKLQHNDGGQCLAPCRCDIIAPILLQLHATHYQSFTIYVARPGATPQHSNNFLIANNGAACTESIGAHADENVIDQLVPTLSRLDNPGKHSTHYLHTPHGYGA